MKTSTSVSTSSAGDSMSVISSSLTVSNGLNTSTNQTSSEKKEELTVNNKFRRNLGFVAEDNNQGKVGNDMAVIVKQEDNSASKIKMETLAPLKDGKITPNVPSGETKKGASFEGAAPWIPDEATHDVPQTPSLSAKVTKSSEVLKNSKKDLEKESPTVLSGRGSEKMSVNNIATKSPHITALLGTEVSSRAQVREGPNVPNVKSPDERKGENQGTTLRGAKKGSTKIPNKDSVNSNSVTDPGKPSVNVKEKNDSEGMACKLKESDSSAALQKPSLSSEVRPVFTTNCFSISSSNAADHNGELFSGEGLKTYSRKATANKRKSGSKDILLEDNSTVSKVSKVDNKESSEVDRMEDIIHKNSKVELAKKLNKKLANSHLEEQTLNSLPQTSVSSSERSKASRKKSTDESKVQAKRKKFEENASNNAEAVRHKSVSRLQLKDNTISTRKEDESLVDSVSFVADQLVEEVSINHSPTAKDTPGNQFEAVKVNSERLSSRSKERIRELTSKKKELKTKEEKKKEKKNAAVSLPSTVKKEPDTTVSLETVVDSVLDEEIAVIYKPDGKCNKLMFTKLM